MLPVSEHDDPSPLNNYRVSFASVQCKVQEINGQPGPLRCHYWKNRDARSSIKKVFAPYHPYNNSKLKLQFEEDIKCINQIQKDLYFLNETRKECLTSIYIYLNPNDLKNFSEASKCCYLATKSNYIWQIQINKLLPNVKFLPPLLCSFTPQQQFQIIFKKIKEREKPFATQLNYYRKREVKIKTFIRKYKVLRENKKDIRLAYILITNYIQLLEIELENNIGPDGGQSRCLTALELIPKQEFDIQENFNNIILSAKPATTIAHEGD